MQKPEKGNEMYHTILSPLTHRLKVNTETKLKVNTETKLPLFKI